MRSGYFTGPSDFFGSVPTGFGPGWSVGVEYDHLWMGNANNDFTVVRPLATLLSDRVSQDVDMVTVRFNYRFGGSGGYGYPPARY